MSDTPMLKNIAILSCIDQEGLRFINLTSPQIDDLLNELERAHDCILNGELLGVQIIEDLWEESK